MSWIDDLERRTAVRAELPIHTDRIREAISRMPDIELDMLSPELRAQLAEAVKALAELGVVLDEYDEAEECPNCGESVTLAESHACVRRVAP